MKRFVIITVGKTHSGKTTFARELEDQLNHSVVIDQDNHAEAIQTDHVKVGWICLNSFMQKDLRV